MPADRLKELAPLEREGSVDEDLLEDSEARIESYLRQQGYWKADVTVRREATDAALDDRLHRESRAAVSRGRSQPRSPARRRVPPASWRRSSRSSRASSSSSPQLAAGVTAILAILPAARICRRRRQVGRSTRPIRRARRGLGAGAGQGLVRAAIVIAEGSRSIVGEVRITGTSAVPVDELRPLVKINAGDPYFEPRIVETRDALVLEYLNRGFASAVVNVALSASADHTRVDLTFTVQEGPQSIVDHILIVGNAHTKPDVILRELQFKPGEPLGLQDQFESRRRLSALGLFRRVQITPLTHGTGNRA